MKVSVRARPWKKQTYPKKILAMRFQALGDTIATLPYLLNIKRQFPDIELHFLTRKEVSSIPQNIELFDKIITIGGKRNLKLQLTIILLKLPWLWMQRYDAVIDLQNHAISKLVRRLLFVKAWSEFDKSSPVPGGERIRSAIEAVWSWKVSLDPRFKVLSAVAVQDLLNRNGRLAGHDLIVLNPAGYCSSRNWPLERYVQFSKLWLTTVNPLTQFVLLLLPAQRVKSDYIKSALGENCIDLTGKADQVQAFSVIKECRLMLSEDSGLMHMAWTQGVATVALFSSSRKDWSMPLGDRSVCLDSSDLDCGPCNLEVCIYNDNRCLTRYSSEFLVQQASALLTGHNITIKPC
jgi:heptosyltransferase-2